MAKLSRYIAYGALFGAAWAIGEIAGELIARRLENAESNLKDDTETDPADGGMREAIISNEMGSTELRAIATAWYHGDRKTASIPMPDV